MQRAKADLVEIFSSFQGEGLFVGAKQIFIRFAGCNLKCSFCDTPKEAVIRGVTVEEVLGKVKKLEKIFGSHHSVSLTGGEPLLHAVFLERLLPRLKEQNFKTYLETNGTLSEELKRIIEYIDIIAMDIKLPSSTVMSPLWKSHIEFLKIATNKEIFVKAVVTNDTLEKDIMKARDIVERFDKHIPFVIQPATPSGQNIRQDVLQVGFKVEKSRLSSYCDISKERLKDVRVIPQVHKFIGVE